MPGVHTPQQVKAVINYATYAQFSYSNAAITGRIKRGKIFSLFVAIAVAVKEKRNLFLRYDSPSFLWNQISPPNSSPANSSLPSSCCVQLHGWHHTTIASSTTVLYYSERAAFCLHKGHLGPKSDGSLFVVLATLKLYLAISFGGRLVLVI